MRKMHLKSAICLLIIFSILLTVEAAWPGIVKTGCMVVGGVQKGCNLIGGDEERARLRTLRQQDREAYDEMMQMKADSFSDEYSPEELKEASELLDSLISNDNVDVLNEMSKTMLASK